MRGSESDTIAALSSGHGRSAVAVVRLSGDQCSAVLQSLIGRLPMPRVAELASLHAADGAMLDRAIVLFFPAPKSFTGEDVAELHLHGSRAIVKRVLQELCSEPGIRLARPGEFSERAFENGKLDLLEVEDLADLIDSETELQRVLSGGWGRSRFRQKLATWRQALLEISALTEAQIDFSDEGDIPVELWNELRKRIAITSDEIRQLLSEKIPAERVRDGYQVVIAGPPNAGKSTLMNALAGRDVAIVSPIAGTTRDVLEVKLDLRGLPIVLRDVAGLRDSQDQVEQIGIRRAEAAIAAADMVLWLDPVGADPQDPPTSSDRICRVVSKADLPSVGSIDASLAISAETGHGMAALLEHLYNAAEETFRFGEATIMMNLRQEACLSRAVAHLETAGKREAEDLEFMAEDIRGAVLSLRSLVGDVGVEDVLGEIFGRFCIGK